MKQRQRLFLSLRQQLIHEISFVRNVSRPYRDVPKKLDIIEFDYRQKPCKLVLNGKVMLETQDGSHHVESYRDLVKGLIQSNNSKKKSLFLVCFSGSQTLENLGAFSQAGRVFLILEAGF